MVSFLLLILFCGVLPIGLAILTDRASPNAVHRITSWPFSTMPGTNGAIIGLLFVLGMATLLYWAGALARSFKWI